MKSWQNNLNEIFNLNAFFFFLLTGATWYYHTIYLVFTYFALFTDYEDDIFEVISNLHVQGSKFGGKMTKFGGKSFKMLNSTEFIEFVFSRYGGGSVFLLLLSINYLHSSTNWNFWPIVKVDFPPSWFARCFWIFILV